MLRRKERKERGGEKEKGGFNNRLVQMGNEYTRKDTCAEGKKGRRGRKKEKRRHTIRYVLKDRKGRREGERKRR